MVVKKKRRRMRTRKEKGMLEAQVERTVARWADKYCIMHRKYTSPNHRNVPDRVFFPVGGRPFFIEFKREKGGKLTTGQEREIGKLRVRGYAVYIVHDMEIGKRIIEEYYAMGG